MKLTIGLLVIFIAFLTTTTKVHAVCPLCTVAVWTGVGLCRYLGIDDTVSGLWIGGLILSSGLWLADFLKKKNFKLPYLNFLSILLFFLLMVPPLYWKKMIGISGNTFWGVDKLLLGIFFGSTTFLLGVLTDKILRRKNHDKVYIYFQKVILPILYLAIASFIFYQITC